MKAKNSELNQLIEVILKLNTHDDVEEFLRGILTSSELTDITQRLQIIKNLKAGVPQREIAEKLGVGIATVTRGSKELQLGRFSHV